MVIGTVQSLVSIRSTRSLAAGTSIVPRLPKANRTALAGGGNPSSLRHIQIILNKAIQDQMLNSGSIIVLASFFVLLSLGPCGMPHPPSRIGCSSPNTQPTGRLKCCLGVSAC